MKPEIPPVRLPSVAHFVGGFLASFISKAAPLAATFVFAGFFLYEIIEFMVLHDIVWKDIREFLIGLTLGAVALYLLLFIRR